MIIRKVTEIDVPTLLDIYTPYITDTTTTFETEIPSLEEFKKRVADFSKDYPYLVAEVGGKIVGYAYAHAYYGRAAYAWTVEVAIYVEQGARQSGIGTALYDELEKQLADQGIVNILACLTYPNQPSLQFHLKRGYEQIGHFKHVGYKFDQWLDTIWLQKTLGKLKR